MPMHPLPIMLNYGLPVVLCSDDPGTFGHMGLTFDYYQVSHLLLERITRSDIEWFLGAGF